MLRIHFNAVSTSRRRDFEKWISSFSFHYSISFLCLSVNLRFPFNGFDRIYFPFRCLLIHQLKRKVELLLSFINGISLFVFSFDKNDLARKTKWTKTLNVENGKMPFKLPMDKRQNFALSLRIQILFSFRAMGNQVDHCWN